ncbi:MAG: hypothetical protein PHH30_00890 [Bacteroidales bacterium]|nr:hypothetical protein [Bacteroidales bacterium]MDD3861088.1 hypothetical protein [Bacteroidales bacterium]
MKNILSILVILFITSQGYSQLKIPVGTNSDLNKFMKSTTYFVLKNDLMSDFNDALKEAAEKHWTITPYEFIYLSDFEKLKKDTDKSFLMINQVYFEKDKSQTLFDFLILTIGGNYKTIDDMPTLCAVPLCYNGAMESEYDYKTGLMIKFIQNHILTCKQNPDLNENNIADFYMSKNDSLKGKTLFLLKEEVAPDIRTKNSFASAYPYNFDYTTRDNITSLINKNTKDGLILHILGPQIKSTLSYCIKIIIDTENGFVYYYDMHKINKNNPAHLLESDLKKLAKKE